jgi:hypothetical protein
MYVMYYTSMLGCWQVGWILVRTNHSYLRVRRHMLDAEYFSKHELHVAVDLVAGTTKEYRCVLYPKIH